MKLSLVIAHVNHVPDLSATIESHVKALRGIEYEIIVCDNMSDPDDLLELQKYLATRDDTTLVFESIKGTVAPFQKAIRFASGEYLCISDQHIRVAPDFYKQQLAIMEADESIGTLYTKCYFNLDREDDFSYQYNWGHNGNWKSSYAQLPNSDEPYEVLVSQMGAAITRRELFEDFGGFSATCFNKWGGYTAEELLLGLKTWMWGKRVVMNPNTYYRHCSLTPHSRGVIKNQPAAMATAAYLLDGEDRLKTLITAWGDKIINDDPSRAPYKSFEEAYSDIVAETTADRQWLLEHQKITLQEVINHDRFS